MTNPTAQAAGAALGFQVEVTGIETARAAINGVIGKMPRAIDRALAAGAMELTRMIKIGIRNQKPGGVAFKPLAETTKKMKRSSKALIDKGDLLRSIHMYDVQVAQGKAWFVGVHKQTRARDGNSMVNIAEIHEFGTKPFNIPVTRKLARWWDAMVAKGIFRAPLDPRTMWLKHPGVPARPFLRPSFDEWKKTANDRFASDLLQALGIAGMLGRSKLRGVRRI